MTTMGPYSYDGGLVTAGYPYFQGNNQYTESKFLYYGYGSLKKRFGSIALTTEQHPGGANPIVGMYERIDSSGNYFIYAVCNKKFGVIDEALNGSWTDATGAATLETLGTYNGTVRFAELNNIVVFVPGNSAGAVMKRAPSTNVAVLGGSPPSSMSLVTVVNNYMFLSGSYTTTNKSRIYWSNVGDPETWGASNYIDYTPNDGDNVIEIVGMNDYLIIFKRNKIGRLWTNPASSSLALGPLTTITDKIGIARRDCVTTMPDGRLCFVGNDEHIYIYDGSTITDISNPPPQKSNIQSSLNNQFIGSTSKIMCFPQLNEIWVYLSGTNTVWAYDYIYNSWVSTLTDRTIGSSVVVNKYKSGSLLTGGATGYMYLQHQDSKDVESGNSFQSSITKYAVVDPSDDRSLQPRSLVWPMRYGNNTSTFYWTWDDVSPTNTKNVIVTQSTAMNRVIVPLTTCGKTSYLKVQHISFSNTVGLEIFPFFLSDSVNI